MRRTRAELRSIQALSALSIFATMVTGEFGASSAQVAELSKTREQMKTARRRGRVWTIFMGRVFELGATMD